MTRKTSWTVLATAMVAVTIMASIAMAAPILQMVPPISGQTASEARAITSDGRYVVGTSGTTSGLFWDSVTAPGDSIAPVAGSVMKYATGVAYRTYNSTQEVAVFGLLDYSSGNNTPVIGITTDGGTTWNKAWRDGVNYANSNLGAANTLKAPGSTDVLWAGYGKGGQYSIAVTKGTGLTTGLTIATDSKGTNTGSELTVNGVSAAGMSVGSRLNAGVKNSYRNLWVGNGTGAAAYVPGLDPLLSNEAYSAAGDATTGKVFGRTYTAGGVASTYYPYMYDYATATLSYLPMFGNEQGSTSLGVPYGCSDDGRYVSGMLYRGQERAVLWDTQLGTVTDLTQFAIDNGIIDGFTGNLRRGYSVGVNAQGQPVVAGMGYWYDALGTGYARGFVLTLPEPTTLGLLLVGGLVLLRRRR
jgi:hypothetical protein